MRTRFAAVMFVCAGMVACDHTERVTSNADPDASVDLSDSCEPGESVCVGDTEVWCVYDDSTGVWSWGEAIPCQLETRCIDGRCVEVEQPCDGYPSGFSECLSPRVGRSCIGSRWLWTMCEDSASSCAIDEHGEVYCRSETECDCGAVRCNTIMDSQICAVSPDDGSCRWTTLDVCEWPVEACVGSMGSGCTCGSAECDISDNAPWCVNVSTVARCERRGCDAVVTESACAGGYRCLAGVGCVSDYGHLGDPCGSGMTTRCAEPLRCHPSLGVCVQDCTTAGASCSVSISGVTSYGLCLPDSTSLSAALVCLRSCSDTDCQVPSSCIPFPYDDQGLGCPSVCMNLGTVDPGSSCINDRDCRSMTCLDTPGGSFCASLSEGSCCGGLTADQCTPGLVCSGGTCR